MFQMPQQAPAQQMAVVANAPPQVHLMSVDRNPLSYQAQWSEIHDDSKAVLLAIEERMLEYREESRRLDQCQRLYDSAALHKGFEHESQRICQELVGVGACISTEQAALEEQVQNNKLLLRNTEVAVRSFMALRPTVQSSTLNAAPAPANASALSFPITTLETPQPNTATGPTEFYCGLPAKPSKFLLQTVARFEERVAEYLQRVGELERVLQDSDAMRDENGNTDHNPLRTLPNVMRNVHDVFIHVAAEMETLHQKVESMRIAYLADRRRRGDDRDPFLEADRREVSKREIAGKRVHPTLTAQVGNMTPQTFAPTFPSVPVAQNATPAVNQAGGGFFGASQTNAFSPFATASVGLASSSPFPVTPAVPAFGVVAPNTLTPSFGTGTNTASGANAAKPKPRGIRRK